ncbi:MAG: caspase family protein [Myxococcales bacterium]|nr:caspase family protein [Myxococcales bacterium]
MNRTTTTLLALAALLATSIYKPAPASAAAAPRTTTRFALVVGANDGGKGRVRLRYALSDARAMAAVMKQLGGVRSEHVTLLLEPNRDRLARTLAKLGARLKRARARGRVELFFYYSGHSDERGLLLGGKHLTYLQVRHAIRALPADVRVAVLDSCASGAITRTKGGIRRPPFLVSGAPVRGHAFLTSAAANEAAQESDRVGGSFFTHYLVSGLRGAADVDHDGRVTLDEAYKYAFAETLARTESTRAGPQHANYDMQLAGSGNLVLTELRGSTALLELGPDVQGRVVIRDDKGRLVAEINKRAARAMRLGLPPGRYIVRLAEKAQVRHGTFTLSARKAQRVARADLRDGEPRVAHRTRGGSPYNPAPPPDLPAPHYRRVAFSFALLPGVGWGGSGTITNFSFGLIASHTTRLRGMDVGLGATFATEDARGMQLSLGFNYIGHDLRGIQLTLGANYIGRDLKGLQVSLGANMLAEDLVAGAQFTLGMNLASRDMLGSQIALGLNVAGGDVDGTQIALGANIAAGVVDGAQISLGTNVAARGVDGTQITLGANIAAGEMRGSQIAVGLNQARHLSGVQIGLLNVGGTINGAQIGLINIAHTVTATQIGLINAAARSDRPVGLLSFIGDGMHHVELWSGDTSYINLGFKLGGRNLYSLFAAGFNQNGDRWRWMAGLGFGGRIPLGNCWYIDTDLVAYHVSDDEAFTANLNMLAKYRLMVGYRFHTHFGVFIGATANLQVTRTGDDRPFGLFAGRTLHRGETMARMWPGFIGGVSF